MDREIDLKTDDRDVLIAIIVRQQAIIERLEQRIAQEMASELGMEEADVANAVAQGMLSAAVAASDQALAAVREALPADLADI